MGTTLLSKLQLGRESTPGTAVAATVIWAGEKAKLTDERKIGQAKQWVGTFIPSARRYTSAYRAALSIPKTDLTFEQFPHICEMGIAAATATAEGSGYARVYGFPTTAANTIKTYTAEAGDDVLVWQVPYLICEKFEISGAAEEPWQVSADLVGRRVTSGSFTSLTAEAGLEVALFQLSKFYLDNSGGTIGASQVQAAVVGFTLTVETGLQPLFTGDGQLYFTIHRQVGPKITGKLVLELNSTTDDEIGYAQNSAVRLLRVDILGSELQTPGSTFSTKAVRFDAAIQYTAVPALDDKDGNTVIELPFEVVDSDSITPTITVVNNKSAL